MDQHAAVLRAFSVVELWRLRRVCRAFHRWGTAALAALPRLAVVGGSNAGDAPVAQRQGYFRVGGWPKVPLWPKTRGITPKTNGYKPAKLAPVA